MDDENSPSGANAEQPKKGRLPASLLPKPVAKVDTSEGNLFLFPLRMLDLSKYRKISQQEPAERVREFLLTIASTSPEYSVDNQRVALTENQVAQLSDQDIENIAEAYVSSDALQAEQIGKEGQEQLNRGESEAATDYIDRLLRRAAEGQMLSAVKFSEKILGSAQGVFDPVRKSSRALGETRDQYEERNRGSASPIGIATPIKDGSDDLNSVVAELNERLASERAEDRQTVRTIGKMSAQSAQLLQDLTVYAGTMLERLDMRDAASKKATNIQLWIAVFSLGASALLAATALWFTIAAYYQDRDNNISGDKWQTQVLDELRTSAKRTSSLEAENLLLHNKIEQLRSSVSALESKMEGVRKPVPPATAMKNKRK